MLYFLTGISSLLLLFLPLCQSIYLDIHVPLPQRDCLEYQALFANRLLRGSSTRLESSPRKTSESIRTDGASSTTSSEQVDLFNKHTPHITLYLANFDLEVNNNNNNAVQQESDGTGDHHIKLQLNQTKVNELASFLTSFDKFAVSQLMLNANYFYATFEKKL